MQAHACTGHETWVKPSEGKKLDMSNFFSGFYIHGQWWIIMSCRARSLSLHTPGSYRLRFNLYILIPRLEEGVHCMWWSHITWCTPQPVLKMVSLGVDNVPLPSSFCTVAVPVIKEDSTCLEINTSVLLMTTKLIAKLLKHDSGSSNFLGLWTPMPPHDETRCS